MYVDRCDLGRSRTNNNVVRLKLYALVSQSPDRYDDPLSVLFHELSQRIICVDKHMGLEELWTRQEAEGLTRKRLFSALNPESHQCGQRTRRP